MSYRITLLPGYSPCVCAEKCQTSLLIYMESILNFEQWGFRVGVPSLWTAGKLKRYLLVTDVYFDVSLDDEAGVFSHGPGDERDVAEFVAQ